MSDQEDLHDLQSLVDALRAEIASKYATSENSRELNSSIELLRKEIDFSARLAKIEEEHNSWKTLAKYLSITLVIVGTALSWLGFKSFDSSIHSEVDKRFAFYSDLSSGLAYTDKHPAFAIPYLLRCFNERPFDEPIIISLLYSADVTDEWDIGRIVLERLNRDPGKSESFLNPLTYNNIAMAALNLSVGNPSFLEDAHRALEMGLRLAPPRSESLWYLRLNLWRYYLALKDYPNAELQIQRLKDLKPPPDVSAWDQIAGWRWSQAIFARDQKTKSEAEKMWRSVVP